MSEIETLRETLTGEHAKASEVLQHWVARLEEANTQIHEWQKAAGDATIKRAAAQADANRLAWMLKQLPSVVEAPPDVGDSATTGE